MDSWIVRTINAWSAMCFHQSLTHFICFFRLCFLLNSLESVCFAILIGVSCDFVIHFGHAYSSLPGDRSRHERSKYAVIRMGPSILAGAFTTICAAVVMLFTVITFFQKFAQICKTKTHPLFRPFFLSSHQHIKILFFSH